MHDAILQQPERIAAMLQSQRGIIENAAAAAARRPRLTLMGIGSSFHAAHIGEQFLRHFSAGAARVGLEQSFELLHYPLQFSRDDALIAISHRGSKNFSVQAMRAAQAAGALAIGVCGEPPGEGMRGADFLFSTCEQEAAFAHTKSYTTALAALALFAILLAERRGYIEARDRDGAIAALERVPELIRATLQCEPHARELAARIAAGHRWIFIGTGPNWATAREAALKVKETSYIAAEGFQTEQFLHGPLSEMDAQAVLTASLAGGPGDYRTVAALHAAGELGAMRCATVTRGALPELRAAAEHVIEVPEVSEWLSPFAHTVALQLLVYYVALERKANPDTGRMEQPPHQRAYGSL
jgi:glucosamine--fructose-6-phosphate aminotransferase (isomerizing)